MKKLRIFALAAIMVLSLAITAQAVPTINDPANGETHLYQIFANSLFNGGVYASSQDIANTVPILETLPAGLYDVTAYASFAGFSQDPGIYSAGNPGSAVYFSSVSSQFPVAGSTNNIAAMTPIIEISSGGSIGFFDDNTASGGDIKYTELALNPGSPSQSNGLIFQISPAHYIVAFEDGGNSQPLGDKDYNDLVLNVNAVPVPPGALLLGSGLLGLGLAGWRRRLFG